MSKSYMLSEKEIKIKNMKTESVEEFLARGGQIKTLDEGHSKEKKQPKKINAQMLLDAAIGTADEAVVIAFLASQGIDVQ